MRVLLTHNRDLLKHFYSPKAVDLLRAIVDLRMNDSDAPLTGETLVAAGGRVLTICGTGADVASARAAAYAGVDAIEWNGAVFRRDIGIRALARSLP